MIGPIVFCTGVLGISGSRIDQNRVLGQMREHGLDHPGDYVRRGQAEHDLPARGSATVADFGHKRTLYLTHEHDSRDLQLENAEKTLAYVYRLWGREVVIETVVSGKKTLLTFNERGFSAKTIK